MPYRVSAFLTPAGVIRHVLLESDSCVPMRAASLYEAHLAQKTDSHNTRATELSYFASLYEWADEHDIPLDTKLLTGQGLTIPHVHAFAAWLKAQRAQPNGVIPQRKRRTVNAALRVCAAISRWFITAFASPATNRLRRTVDIEMLVQAQRRAWNGACIKVRQDPAAPDLTDDEVAAIDAFLTPELRSNTVEPAIAVRDFLMWRMAIEFGMRKGEILAMRTIDCPTRATPFFRIVRIEERGPNYADPRNNPPRPKTLSRDLGFMFENTAFPRLVTEYISTYRFTWIKGIGKRKKRFLLPHNFLIISKSGEPLSPRAADDVAKSIRTGTGINFHWHLARHTFFNRAYAAVTNHENPASQQARLSDLVYWGGWKSEQSLDIYTRRARARKARLALKSWIEENTAWTSLG